MRRYAYIHNYGPVLDQTVQSGPAFSQTGRDCSLRVLNRRVRSFYRSTFLSDKKTGPNSPVQYFWNRTAVQRYWTVRSSLFTRSPKKATVRTGLDCGPRVPDRTVRSFYRSPFRARDRTVFSRTGPYFSVRTAVPIDQTVQSGLFYGLQKRLQSGTGLDRGQSIPNHWVVVVRAG